MAQKDYRLVRDNFRVIDGKKKLNHEVLLQSFKDFCHNNIVDEKEKHSFKKNDVAIALCYAASHNHFIWNIRVYETLGLDREQLLKYDAEERDLDLYNQKLKSYGLSLDEKISKEERKILEQEDPDYDKKKGFMK